MPVPEIVNVSVSDNWSTASGVRVRVWFATAAFSLTSSMENKSVPSSADKSIWADDVLVKIHTSWPSSPSIRVSDVSPCISSSPSEPNKVSLPSSPKITSLPSLPVITSLFAPPSIRSLNSVPSIVLAANPPISPPSTSPTRTLFAAIAVSRLLPV